MTIPDSDKNDFKAVARGAGRGLSLPAENTKTVETELFIAKLIIHEYDESAGHIALLAGSYSWLELAAAVGTCNLREVASDP